MFLKKLILKIIDGERKVIGLNRRNVEFVRKYNKRSDFPLANDKILAKEFFTRINIPVAKNLILITSLFELSKLKYNIFKLPSFVAKPANGSKGNGIFVITKVEDGFFYSPDGRRMNYEKLQYNLASILFGKFSLGHQDSIIIEELLLPCLSLSEVSINGLFDIRIIMIKNELHSAMLRLPTLNSKGKANLSQGGIGVGIDTIKGVTVTAMMNNEHLTHHPDSTYPLIGIQIPAWKKMLKMCTSIAKHSPLKFIGIDLTIDEKRGPLVLEFNARPGLEIQNVNLKGLRDFNLEKSLYE